MENDKQSCRCTPGNYADDCPKHGSGVNIVGGETPRTDTAEDYACMFSKDTKVVHSSTARTLEKELNSAKARIGICPVCNQEFQHDVNEPFASCKCGTTEWPFQDITKEPLVIQLATLRTALAAAEKAREEAVAEQKRLRTAALAEWCELRTQVSLLIAERDTATAALEAKTKECEAVRLCFSDASHSSSATIVHVETLQAALEAMTRERDEAEDALREICLQMGFDPSDDEGTSPKEVFKLVAREFIDRDLALASLKTAREALESVHKQLECPCRNTTETSYRRDGSVIISSDVRQQVSQALAVLTPAQPE